MFPGGSVIKNPPVNAGEAGLIPRSGKSTGGDNGNPLQYSCLGKPMEQKTGRLQFMESQRVGQD